MIRAPRLDLSAFTNKVFGLRVPDLGVINLFLPRSPEVVPFGVTL